AQGVLSLRMGQLRDAYGAQRLGIQVRTNISEELGRRGIVHYPVELPESQNAWVRLFKLGTPIGDLGNTLATFGPADDEKLRLLGVTDSQSVLEKIRQLVCSD